MCAYDCASGVHDYGILKDIYLKMKELTAKFLRGAVKIIGRLPLKFHYAFCGFIVWLIKNIMHYRYDVVYTNLARSFPECHYNTYRTISDDFYNHLGEIFAEAVWFGASDYKRLNDSGIVKITNPEVLNDHFLNTPNVTVLFSHCGNWEILGGFLGYNVPEGQNIAIQEKHIKVVYKKLHNELSDRFFKSNRVAPLEEVGMNCEIESSDILRFAIRHRNEKNVYIYIADQYPYMGAHDIGTVLNQPTLAMLGSAGVAHKLGHSVLYLKMKRIRRGHYEMTFIPICRNASEHTPEEIMRKYFDLLEMEIRETPYNWLWSHKRWK